MLRADIKTATKFSANAAIVQSVKYLSVTMYVGCGLKACLEKLKKFLPCPVVVQLVRITGCHSRCGLRDKNPFRKKFLPCPVVVQLVRITGCHSR